MRSSKAAWRQALRVTAAAAVLALFAPPVTRPQETVAAQAAAKASDAELAKKLSNPIADLVSADLRLALGSTFLILFLAVGWIRAERRTR